LDEKLPVMVWDDPLYAEGMAHLQSAEWQEAVRCFETLAARIGDDPAVAAGLAQARFKAKLDAQTHVRPRRWAFSWRPIVVRILLVVALLVIGVLGLGVLNRQIEPAVAMAQRAQQIEGLLKDGQSNLEAWKLDEAALAALIDDVIADLGATSPREMGKVMSAVMAKAGAQVDGKLASRLVKERLSA